jgi:DUF4097 and DUF4098 domain-containing protein YvlB
VVAKGTIFLTTMDIDFLCKTNCEVSVQQLFPAAARCDTDTMSTIPAGFDLYFEITSTSGELATKI